MSTDADERGRRREPWPLAIAGGLLAMAAVLGAFLYAALSHPDPVLVHDAFAASGRYDAALRAEARAQARGLRLELGAQPAPGGTRITVRLVGADGRARPADRVRVRRERPTQGGFDTDLAATPSGDGWEAFVALPLAGRWVIEARAERGDGAIERRIEVEATP
jgi:nitrogen fixation protein FixH